MTDTSSDVAPAPRPVREKGYASTSTTWWSDLTTETTPELRWPLSIAVFDQMRRQDAQVASVLRAVTSPIVRTQWRVDGRGCSDEVTRFVAGNLGLPIVDADPADIPDPSADPSNRAQMRGRDRFSWDEHLRLALLMLPFGHMFFEQVYRYDDPTGRFRLRKLGPRLPRTISQVNVARDGGLVSIQQYGPSLAALPVTAAIATGADTVLPVNRLVAYVLEREGGNWLGQSLLRSAYKNWLLKDRALRTWSTLIDRNGLGIPDYEAAESEKSLDAGEDLMSQVRAGDNAGLARPNGSSFKLVGVTGTLPDIDAFVRYQDEQIARSALGHFLNLGGGTAGQVGSYNLGSVLSDTFNLSLGAVADLIADVATSHIVEDLVDINFGASVPAPQLVFDEIGTRASELDKVREAAGLSSDADLVQLIRTIPDQQEAP